MSEPSSYPETHGVSAQVIEAIEALLAYREREEVEASDTEASAESLSPEPSPTAVAAAARVSARAYKLIVEYETGGRAYYDRVIKSRPIWPKASSGITIGFGYDLGYVSVAEFQRDWAALIATLTSAQRAALTSCVGFHSGKDSAAKMQALLGSVLDIRIPWDAAEVVFKAKTLPKFASLTVNALPNCGELSDDCFGTLVSLTFNRGASYSKAHDPNTDPRDRYREMRAIKADMATRRFDDIPRQIKAMIRIWVGTAIEQGMRRRRTDEAALFLSGLAVAVAAASEEAVPRSLQRFRPMSTA